MEIFYVIVVVIVIALIRKVSSAATSTGPGETSRLRSRVRRFRQKIRDRRNVENYEESTVLPPPPRVEPPPPPPAPPSASSAIRRSPPPLETIDLGDLVEPPVREPEPVPPPPPEPEPIPEPEPVPPPAEVVDLDDPIEVPVPEPELLPPEPSEPVEAPPSERDPGRRNVKEVAAALFAAGVSGSEADRIYADLHDGEQVEGSGKIERVDTYRNDSLFGEGPGVRAVLTVHEITEDFGGAREVRAVVQLPPETEENLRARRGETIGFQGRLVCYDGFLRDLYVADGALVE